MAPRSSLETEGDEDTNLPVVLDPTVPHTPRGQDRVQSICLLHLHLATGNTARQPAIAASLHPLHRRQPLRDPHTHALKPVCRRHVYLERLKHDHESPLSTPGISRFLRRLVQTLETPSTSDQDETRPLQQPPSTEAEDTPHNHHRWTDSAASKRSEVPRSYLRPGIEFQDPLERNEEEDLLKNRTPPLPGKKHGRRPDTHAQYAAQESRSLNHHLRRNDIPQLQDLLEDSTSHPKPGAESCAPCPTIHALELHPPTTARTEALRLLLASNSTIREQRHPTWEQPHPPHHTRNSQAEEQRGSPTLLSVDVFNSLLKPSPASTDSNLTFLLLVSLLSLFFSLSLYPQEQKTI